jgi:capsular exopolysaccharide synthesis family protein
LSANNGASVRLNELERNADSVKTLYQSYLDRFKETSAEQGIEESDARILSRAQVPGRPSSPNVPVNMALGLILGLVAGLGATAIAEAFDQGVSTGDQIENDLEIPSLAAIPLLSSVATDRARGRLSPTDFIVEKPLSRFAEAFRALRTAVVYSNVDRRIQVVAVSSSVPGEGKTTTTVGLARTAAMAGTKVCMIDCDLRRRSVHKLFGLEPQKGLLDILSGACSIEEVMLQDAASGAFIIPLADSAYSPKDVFGSEAMERLLIALRARFEMVILDTAPILAVADAAVVASKADTVLFLTRWRRTPIRLVRNSLKALNAVGANVAGVALTQVDVREQVRAGYGEAAYYFKKYSEYYTDS